MPVICGVNGFPGNSHKWNKTEEEAHIPDDLSHMRHKQSKEIDQTTNFLSKLSPEGKWELRLERLQWMNSSLVAGWCGHVYLKRWRGKILMSLKHIQAVNHIATIASLEFLSNNSRPQILSFQSDLSQSGTQHCSSLPWQGMKSLALASAQDEMSVKNWPFLECLHAWAKVQLPMSVSYCQKSIIQDTGLYTPGQFRVFES